jgi:hypothetical protein
MSYDNNYVINTRYVTSKFFRNYTQTILGFKLTPQLLHFLSAGFHTTKMSV